MGGREESLTGLSDAMSPVGGGGEEGGGGMMFEMSMDYEEGEGGGGGGGGGRGLGGSGSSVGSTPRGVGVVPTVVEGGGGEFITIRVEEGRKGRRRVRRELGWSFGVISLQGIRKNQEDQFTTIPDLSVLEEGGGGGGGGGGGEPQAFYAIYDGHCGVRAARYARELTHHYLVGRWVGGWVDVYASYRRTALIHPPHSEPPRSPPSTHPPTHPPL